MTFLDYIFAPAVKAPVITGYMEWEFGMTKDDVRATFYGPFHEVESTNGLTTNHGLFLNHRTPIAFSFNQGKLNRIQLWIYAGEDRAKAAIAFAKVHGYLNDHGEVESTTIDLSECKRSVELADFILDILDKPHKKDKIRKYQFKLKEVKPEGVTVFSSLIEHPTDGYFVFLYFDRKI